MIWWALSRKGEMEKSKKEKYCLKVRFHQGSVLNSFFAVVMDEITKDVREGAVKELLY